jgi:hypothetical protein
MSHTRIMAVTTALNILSTPAHVCVCGGGGQVVGLKTAGVATTSTATIEPVELCLSRLIVTIVLMQCVMVSTGWQPHLKLCTADQSVYS